MLPPHSPPRLSYRAHSAKLKWEHKHGQPCPYSLPAGKGCPYVRHDARSPLCTEQAEGFKLPERSTLKTSALPVSGVQHCDFGSRFGRDLEDSTTLQESGVNLASGEPEEKYLTDTPAIAIPAVGDGMPRKDEGSRRRGITGKKNADKKKPRPRRCPTLLEIHKRVIDAALLEISRPREGPFENLGDRLGGEHESLTYCYGSSRLLRDSSSAGSLPQCAAVERCPSRGNSTGVSTSDEFDRGPISPKRLRALAVNAQARDTVMPPFREHDRWEIPLLRSGAASGERSGGPFCDYRFANKAEYGPSEPCRPEASKPRDRLVARSVVSCPVGRSSKTAKSGRKRRGKFECAAKHAREDGSYSPSSSTEESVTGTTAVKARQTASATTVVIPELEHEGVTEASTRITDKTTAAPPERAPRPPDGFERNVAADQLMKPLRTPADQGVEKKRSVPGPTIMCTQLNRKEGTKELEENSGVSEVGSNETGTLPPSKHLDDDHAHGSSEKRCSKIESAGCQRGDAQEAPSRATAEQSVNDMSRRSMQTQVKGIGNDDSAMTHAVGTVAEGGGSPSGEAVIMVTEPSVVAEQSARGQSIHEVVSQEMQVQVDVGLATPSATVEQTIRSEDASETSIARCESGGGAFVANQDEDDNSSLDEDASNESSGVGWTAKPEKNDTTGSYGNNARDLFSLDRFESEATADQSVGAKPPTNDKSEITQHVHTPVVCERLDEEGQSQGAMTASSVMAQQCADNAVSQGVRVQVATIFRVEAPVPRQATLDTELEGTRLGPGIVANTPSVVAGQCVNELLSYDIVPTQFVVGLSDKTAAATETENLGDQPMETVLASESSVTAEPCIVKQCIDEVVPQGTQPKLAFEETSSRPQVEVDTEDALASLGKSASEGTSSTGRKQPIRDASRGDLGGGSGATTPALSSVSSSLEFEIGDDSSTEANTAAVADDVSRQDEESSLHEADTAMASLRFKSSKVLSRDSNHPSALENQGIDDSRVEAKQHQDGPDATHMMSITTVEESIHQAILLVGSSSTEMERREAEFPYQTVAVGHTNTGRAKLASEAIAALVEEWVWGAINSTATAASPIPLVTADLDLPLSSAYPRDMTTTEMRVSADDTVRDGKQPRAVNPPPFVAPALPPGFLSAIVARRGSLKPTPCLQELAKDERTEIRLREERAEVEVKDRAVELRELADLVRSAGFDRYSPEAFSRGVLYGEGRHSVVYRAEGANFVRAREEDSVQCAPGVVGAEPPTVDARAAVRTTARKTTHDAVSVAVAGAMTEALNSAGPKPISASVLSGNVVASTVATAVSSVVEASTRRKDYFAAKEFRYAGQEAPVPILRHARREISMHARVRGCKRIVELHGLWISPRITLILEGMNAGSLHQFIRDRKMRCDGHGKIGGERETTAAEMARVVADVADALVTLHCARIVHRDVKSHNIMMVSRPLRDRLGSSDGYDHCNNVSTGRTDEDFEWGSKLGDLGSAELIPIDGDAVLTEEAGTSGWVAPEVRYSSLIGLVLFRVVYDVLRSTWFGRQLL